MYRLIVDTENYAGNFERELGGYVTGLEDESFRISAVRLAQEARVDMVHHAWWEENLVMQDDERYPGIEFVCRIHPTPNWVNDGRGAHHHIDSDDAQNLKETFPAYLSVRFVVKQLPPPDVWEEFQDRATEFCETKYGENMSVGATTGPVLTITGVRQENMSPSFKIR